MCGLCGWFGQPDLADAKRRTRARVSEGLLLANAARGTDAAGIGIVRADGGQEIYKRAVSSHKIVDQPAFSRLARDKDASLLIGHTRLKTHGANTNRNAHPFREGDVMGAHNGMVWNHDDVERYLRNRYKKPAAVDSQVIFRVLADGPPNGVEYARMLPLLDGSMALTWWDKRDPSGLWMFAHENPLSVAVVPSIGTMFWSSQYDHLAPALWTAYGTKWYSVNSNIDKAVTRFEFAPDGTLEFEEWECKMPKWTSYTGSGKGVTRATSMTDEEWNDWYRKRYGEDEDDEPSVKTAKEIIDAQFPVRVPIGELDAQIRNGTRDDDGSFDVCGMCYTVIDWDDEDAIWHNEGEGYMLCGTCDRWWTRFGTDMYDDLEDAIVARSNGGEFASAAVEATTRIPDAVARNIARNNAELVKDANKDNLIPLQLPVAAHD